MTNDAGGLTPRGSSTHGRCPARTDVVAGCLFVWAFAFDFKGPDGGSPAQSIFAAFSLAAVAILTLRARSGLHGRRALVGCAWLLCAMIGFCSAAAYQSASDIAIKTGGTVVLGFMAVCVTHALDRLCIPYRAVLRWLFYAGLASMIWRAFYALHVKDVALEQMRYQLLSEALFFVFAYGVANVLHPKGHFLLGSVGVLGAITSVILSVTRGALAGLAVQAILCFVLLVRNGNRRFVDTRWILGRLMKVTVLGGLAVGACCLLRPNVLQNWSSRTHAMLDRNVESSEDTAAARWAQIIGAWALTGRDGFSTAFGKGFGIVPEHDATNLVRREVGLDRDIRHLRADTTWAPLLLCTGIVGTALVAWALCGAAAWATRGACRSAGPSELEAYVVSVALVGCIAMSLGGNMLAGRFSCVLLGVLTSWRPQRDTMLDGVSSKTDGVTGPAAMGMKTHCSAVDTPVHGS